MKFVSKSGNYRLILDRGIPAEPITGRNAVPGLSVKFEDGIAMVTDDSIIKRMLDHPSFNRDFIRVEDNDNDPFSARRRAIEPEHDVTNIEYGHVGKNMNPRPPMVLTPEAKKILTDMAMDMAKKMAPTLAFELLKTMKEENDMKPVKKVGRPKKAQKVVSAEEFAGATEGNKT
jgi:hypothetical protein